MCKICTFSLRRNLTDSQRTEVIGRIYNTLKQNPVLNLKQFQSKDNGKDVEDRTAKFAVRKGSDATAKAVAEATGVGVRTVRYAGKFAEAVVALERISPKAAEIVRRDEVRDAKTQLPKVLPEALPFVAKRIEEGARSIKRILMEWRQEQKEQQLKERAPLGCVGTHAGTGARTGAREF
jgi:hypothetical protein